MKRGVDLVSLAVFVASLVLVESREATPTPTPIAILKPKPFHNLFSPFVFQLSYHHGALLRGNVKVQILWYGDFTLSQRSLILDFIESLNSIPHTAKPSAFSWWRTLTRYRGIGPTPVYLNVVNQINDNYSLGKKLNKTQLDHLAYRAEIKVAVNFINVVLTSADVAVEDFCSPGCGKHGWVGNVTRKIPFAFVGNPETQCPAHCSWPFHPHRYGTLSLVPPNGDVTVDAMIIYLAALLAEVVTNPFGTGYYGNTSTGILEAATACLGDFGEGAFTGYPGKVLKDNTTGGDYNAVGVRGRKFLLSPIWDPVTFLCKPLV